MDDRQRTEVHIGDHFSLNNQDGSEGKRARLLTICLAASYELRVHGRNTRDERTENSVNASRCTMFEENKNAAKLDNFAW